MGRGEATAVIEWRIDSLATPIGERAGEMKRRLPIFLTLVATDTLRTERSIGELGIERLSA